MTSPGLLFLDDLTSFAPWSGDRARAWADKHERRGAVLPPTVLPPPSLVVVMRSLTWSVLESRVGWLRLAQRIVLVVDESDEPELHTDHELRALCEEERTETMASLGNVVALLLVQGSLDATIAQALTQLSGQRKHDDWPTWQPPALSHGFAPGPWIEWRAPRWNEEREPDMELCLRVLGAQTTLTDDGPVFLDTTTGERLNLQTGARTAVPLLKDAGSHYHPIAAFPEGKRWLRSVSSKRHMQWQIDGASATGALQGTYGQAMGVDPSCQVAWIGTRCWFHWYVITPDGPACWTPSSHGWPDGHGKKLYGYEDNEPLWVHLAPDGSACLSVYQHDVLLTPGLPFRWYDCGDVIVGMRARGEPRALLFQRTDSEDAFPGDPSLGDEDARDHFATVTLGPDEERRYAVGFDATTWRLRGEQGIRLAEANPSWAIYNAQHHEVQRLPGRLLAGWHQWVTVLREDTLVRVDLCSGAEQSLGPAQRNISAALAIAGTPNVLLLSTDARDAWLRLV